MYDLAEEEFDNSGSGASETYPIQAGSIKKNSYCMLKGKPCKVVEYTTSKTGKHGHAKAHIVGLDIFTGKKYDDICPTSHNMEVPVVKRTEYQLIGLDDGYASLITETGEPRGDILLPVDGEKELNETAKKIETLYNSGECLLISVLTACGQEKIVGYKQMDNK